MKRMASMIQQESSRAEHKDSGKWERKMAERKTVKEK